MCDSHSLTANRDWFAIFKTKSQDLLRWCHFRGALFLNFHTILNRFKNFDSKLCADHDPSRSESFLNFFNFSFQRPSQSVKSLFSEESSPNNRWHNRIFLSSIFNMFSKGIPSRNLKTLSFEFILSTIHLFICYLLDQKFWSTKLINHQANRDNFIRNPLLLAAPYRFANSPLLFRSAINWKTLKPFIWMFI